SQSGFARARSPDTNACHITQAGEIGDRMAREFEERLTHPLHVGGVESLVAGADFELDLLSFSERLEAVHGDCGEMHEDVFAALLFNEAITFGIVEPLHFPSGHS